MVTQIQKRPNVYMKEFIRVLSESAEISETNAELLTEKFLRTIAQTLVEKQSICFPEFGIFELRETSERVARNPKTMEEVTIPAGLRPVFRPSRMLKESLNKAVQERAAENVGLLALELDGSSTA